jgi:threonyl-tRNA synthetase
MIHRALYGSLERFIGILIEHYGGDFPLWLAPVQARVIPVSREHLEYAQRVTQRLDQENIRVEMDRRDEKIGYKIRDAETSKVRFMLVVGEKEAENQTVSLRRRQQGQVGILTIDQVVSCVREEIAHKT